MVRDSGSAADVGLNGELSIQTQNRRRLLIARRPGGTFAHLDDGGGFSLPRAV